MDLLFDKTATGKEPAPAGDVIREGTSATFVAEVIEASMTVPVIVDFWATWCGPCKTLGPALERLTREARGKVRLVKIDVDKNQQLAAEFRIKSVPTVYAFKGGRPVDGFTGALPESQLRNFFTTLTGGVDPLAHVDNALAEAQALFDQGEVSDAMEMYRVIFAQNPGNATAAGGVLRCLIQNGDIEGAKLMLDGLPAELCRHPDVASQQAAIELTEKAGTLEPSQQLARRVEENPADHQARFDLALAEFAAGRREAAIDHLLEIFSRDRTWNDDAARKQLVKLFEAMGPADPLTVQARRRLSSLMFS